MGVKQEMLNQQQHVIAPDSTRLLLRENQLRNYHIGKWMRMNRSRKELLELCLDHFYQDQPKLLAWSLDIIDGDPKELVTARMIRESKVGPIQAETLYQQIQNVIALSEKLVDQGSPDAISMRPVARAGVASLGYSEKAEFVIVTRPTIISVCAFLLLLSAAITTLFVAGNFEGSELVVERTGRAGLFLSIAFTAVCGWGYWTMKRWAVLLYAIEPLARFWLGMPNGLIAIPFLIVVFGLMHFREMTWK